MMKRQRLPKQSALTFLTLGIAFLAVGLITDQTVFSWIAIAFIVISFALGGRWRRPGK